MQETVTPTPSKASGVFMGAVIAGMTLIASAALALIIILGLPSRSEAYLVHEVEPGTIQIRGSQNGSLVVENVFVDHKRRWIYLEVKEAGPLSGVSTSEAHFFYVPYRRTSFKSKQHLLLIQYGLSRRVQNSHGKVPFGQKRFFYPLLLFKSVS
jgi:hypothetical protein